MRAVQGANLDARSEMAPGDHEMVRWVDGQLLSFGSCPALSASQKRITRFGLVGISN